MQNTCHVKSAVVWHFAIFWSADRPPHMAFAQHAYLDTYNSLWTHTSTVWLEQQAAAKFAFRQGKLHCNLETRRSHCSVAMQAAHSQDKQARQLQWRSGNSGSSSWYQNVSLSSKLFSQPKFLYGHSSRNGCIKFMLYVLTATAAAFRLDKFHARHCHSMSDAEGYIHSRNKVQMTLVCTWFVSVM